MDPTQEPRDPQPPTLLDAALAYAARGWSLIPINVATKKPPEGLRWKRYQTTPADAARLREWFSGKYRALAVVLGEVSGGLVCRDFDRMDAYEAWATAHPDLARTLPTVATGRPGRHVYFRTAELCFVDLPDGEYRGNSGHYCVVPPSEHPTGRDYRWLTVLPDGELPFVEDVRAAGFLLDGPCNRENGENPDRGVESLGPPTSVPHRLAHASGREFHGGRGSNRLPEPIDIVCFNGGDCPEFDTSVGGQPDRNLAWNLTRAGKCPSERRFSTAATSSTPQSCR
ncbi:MAG: bifunctional DNA primase/polymerase [Planctomycetia bacterium]|nr:bifunctional DNA primase/polymerase [Planctomycetia bacterium]